MDTVKEDTDNSQHYWKTTDQANMYWLKPVHLTLPAIMSGDIHREKSTSTKIWFKIPTGKRKSHRYLINFFQKGTQANMSPFM